MGAGYLGSDEELCELARKEGHPNPESVQSFGELLNWVREDATKVEGGTGSVDHDPCEPICRGCGNKTSYCICDTFSHR